MGILDAHTFNIIVNPTDTDNIIERGRMELTLKVAWKEDGHWYRS